MKLTARDYDEDDDEDEVTPYEEDEIIPEVARLRCIDDAERPYGERTHRVVDGNVQDPEVVAVRQNVVVRAWLPIERGRRKLFDSGRYAQEFLAQPHEFAELMLTSRAHNLLPDVGLNYFRDLAAGAVSRIDKIAVGTGTTAPAATDTALQASVFSNSITRRIQENKKVTFQLLILQSEANGNTLAEIGLLKATTLVARAVISPTIVKTSAIMVTVVHEISFANG